MTKLNEVPNATIYWERNPIWSNGQFFGVPAQALYSVLSGLDQETLSKAIVDISRHDRNTGQPSKVIVFVLKEISAEEIVWRHENDAISTNIQMRNLDEAERSWALKESERLKRLAENPAENLVT